MLVFNLATGCNPVELVVVAKEVIWVSFNVPNSLYRYLLIPPTQFLKQ